MTVINHTWQFIYLHIPKSGGTSVAHALDPLCTWRDLQLGGSQFGELVHRAYGPKFGLAKHSFAIEVIQSVGRAEWNRYVTFATVRHPVERTVSTFQYLKHHQDHYKPMQEINSFSEFLRSAWWEEPGPDRMFMPQHRWLYKPSSLERCLVDTVFTVEELADKIPEFLESTGVPRVKAAKVEIGQYNKSPRLSVEMNADDLERIVQRYEHDFDLFGYDPGTYRDSNLSIHQPTADTEVSANTKTQASVGKTY
ncbi:MAG: sulfotransferase family 2 domain-containing protein [Pseudomonadota bacterium]